MINQIFPDQKTFIRQARDHRLLSLQYRCSADLYTPISLFQKFDDQETAFLLESVIGGERWARYSIMGRRPLIRFSVKRHKMRWQTGQDQPIELTNGNPLHQIKQLLKEYTLPPTDAPLPYRCGLTGFFAYDFIRYLEDLPDDNPDPLDLPDCALMAPAEVLLYDHLKNELIIIVNLLRGPDPISDYRTAQQCLEELSASVFRPSPDTAEVVGVHQAGSSLAVSETDNRQTYLKAVDRDRDYIRRGDIFQVVLSRRFSAPCQEDPLAIYRSLRSVNPSPYLFFVRHEQTVLVGASPEMLVRLDQDKIETCPIAGTRRRGNTEENDRQLADELLADEKEAAEHAMLVDLARNDVGRISQFGTVKVSKFRHVERFSHVMHLVSLVEGKLQTGLSAPDVLAAILPAGTLSGAPKIRAMEIIDELETVRRGAYGGAVGYLGFDGQMDTCITIRTAVIKDAMIHIQAGAGIVADSQALNELAEVSHKAEALIAAISKAGGFQ